MEEAITPSFIDAYVELQKQKEEVFRKKMGKDRLARLARTIFADTPKEKWEIEWVSQAKALYLQFKGANPGYIVDERTFKAALAYHPQGRRIMIGLDSSSSSAFAREYFDKELQRIREIQNSKS